MTSGSRRPDPPDPVSSPSGERSALRTTARVLGVVVSVLWLIPLVGGLVSGNDDLEAEGAALEGLVLSGLVITAIVATGFACFGSRRAAWVVLAAGVALSVFAVVTAGRNHWLAVSVAGVPWLLIGGLFVAADRRPPTDGS